MRLKSLSYCLYLIFFSTVALAELQIDGAWVAEAPPGSRVMAGYMRITNAGDEARSLIAASSEQFEEIQFHRSRIENEMMTMERVDSIVVPAASTVELKSGDLHLMLMRPVRHFKAGDDVDISVRFDNRMQRSLAVPVKKRKF